MILGNVTLPEHMKTLIASWCSSSFSVFLLINCLAMAATCVASYWPLNDEDTKTFKTFVYRGTSQLTMNTADNGGGVKSPMTRQLRNFIQTVAFRRFAVGQLSKPFLLRLPAIKQVFQP
jgi:hypothetical protein